MNILDETTEKIEIKYPDCYLHVTDCRSGETFIHPIGDSDTLDLKTHIEKWIKGNYGNEAKLDGNIMQKLSGDYYAKIMTDGRSPDSIVCWSGGGFYLTIEDY